MNIQFYKYQGTGNDFVIIDCFTYELLELSTAQINRICDRKFGVGADGLILLSRSIENDFKMIYYNADGNESSMCGNGGRCIVHLAHKLGYIGDTCCFEAIDGLHKAKVFKDQIHLQMMDVSTITKADDAYVLNTGSPHYVSVMKDVDSLDVAKLGAQIRYSDAFKAEGINVNFIEKINDKIHIRTYERGVEDETLSCGTGVTAAAIVSDLLSLNSEMGKVNLKSMGGNLSVSYQKNNTGSYHDLWLEGPATMVFAGDLNL